jgi:hypothetical protein
MQHLKDIGVLPLRHEACLYIGKFEELEVLVFRQTDDFMVGGENEPSLRRLANLIGKEVGFLVTPGLVEHYNGLEVVQSHDYIYIFTLALMLTRSSTIMDGILPERMRIGPLNQSIQPLLQR